MSWIQFVPEAWKKAELSLGVYSCLALPCLNDWIYMYVLVYDSILIFQWLSLETDTVPPPRNIILDPINKRLQWDHPFLSQLPPLFELVHRFTIMYQVYGKADGVEVPSLSGVPVFNNYLNFTSESVNHCAEYEFVVQALSNISHVPPSQNVSSDSEFFIGGEYTHVNVLYYCKSLTGSITFL